MKSLLPRHAMIDRVPESLYRASPVDQFIARVCVSIDPIGMIKEMQRRKMFCEGTWRAWLTQRLEGIATEHKEEIARLGLRPKEFFGLALHRIEWVLQNTKGWRNGSGAAGK